MSKTIWPLIEFEDGKAARSSLEVLGKAAHLGRAEAIVLGSAAAEVAATLGEFGAAKVYVHADPVYDNYLTLPAVDTVSALLTQHQPALLLLATTFDLRDIAARLNVRNNMGLITDATDLHFDGDTLLVTVRVTPRTSAWWKNSPQHLAVPLAPPAPLSMPVGCPTATRSGRPGRR